jgi:glycogen debranching enzyme
MSIQDQAIKIVTDSLRACYVANGIIAGPHHFTDYWARDGFFAAFGSLAIGDQEIVEEMLSLFFSHQREDGLIPYRIMRGPLSLSKYWGRPKFYPSPKPTYKLRGVGQPILDGTTLSLLFAALLKKEAYLPQIQLALSYLESKEKHGLLWDGPMGEWNDAVWKWGNLLYSNVIYWYMYDRLANWIKTIDPAFSSTLASKATQIATSLRSRLWNGEYFADWHDYRRQDYIYPFGNSLAIA